LDNCAGSGTTGVACQNTNRNFILIEKEEKYCKIAEQRLSGEIPEKKEVKEQSKGGFFE
jgi:DNA modification methylase